MYHGDNKVRGCFSEQKYNNDLEDVCFINLLCSLYYKNFSENIYSPYFIKNIVYLLYILYQGINRRE